MERVFITGDKKVTLKQEGIQLSDIRVSSVKAEIIEMNVLMVEDELGTNFYESDEYKVIPSEDEIIYELLD